MNNGHFAGKIKRFVDDAVGKAQGTEGSLYKIMNSHGFYDVADENNGLADWQRASVPEYNQHRISDLCDAIAEMIGDMLSNDEYGILYPKLDGIVGKLDLNATKNASQLDVVGGVLGGLTGGASETARQGMGNLTAILMGGFAYDPDILPPIALNLPGLPLDFANAYQAGSFPADWTFLYDHETVKSPTYYAADDGSVAIGAGIKLNTGGNMRQRVMKLIFSVPDVDENGLPKGDAYGGVSVEDFNKMYEVSDKQYDEIKDNDDLKVKLDDVQMQLSFFRMVQLMVWGAIKNPDNWAYLHWGCLTHNACPTAVKTAVCSFLYTNGFAVDPNVSPSTGFLSYCVNVGMAYLTGTDRPQYLFLLPGMSFKNDKGEVYKVAEDDERAYKANTENSGVPVDKDLANLHFTLAADILSHLTYGSNPNAKELRQRRVDEANLIYNYVGLPTMKFGDAIIPNELNANAMDKRGFGKLMNAKIKVFPNSNSTLPLDTKNCKIVNWAEKGANELSDITITTIRYILAKAKLPGIVVTSVYRSPETQANTMFANRQKENGGISVNYGPRGREVDQAYTDVSERVNGGKCYRIDDPAAQKEAKQKMTDVCYRFLNEGTPVSNHGYDQSKVQAVDLGPSSSKQYFKYSDQDMMRMHVACWDAYQEGYLRCYLGPKEYGGQKIKDPAFHIEVWQDPNKKHPTGEGGGATMPSVVCQNDDANLKNKNTWDMVYVSDQTL